MSSSIEHPELANKKTLLDWLNRLGPLIALVLVYTLFAFIAGETFRSGYNMQLMARQTAVVGTAAIGMTLVIIAAGIDLSVGSIIAMVTIVVALTLRNEYPPFVAAIAGILAGTACGVATGLIVTRFKVVPFIVTLGGLLIYRGMAKMLGDEQTVRVPDKTWINDLLSSTANKSYSWILLPPGVWFTLVLAAVVAFVLYYTKLGRHIFAIGSNEETARLCGIAVERVKIYVYMICGACAGIAGLMQFSRLDVGDPTTAIGMELDVIAAVVIGGGSLSGGEGSILGSIVGALIMTIIKSGCTQMGLPTYWQEMITGVIIVVAVALDRYRHRRTA